MNNASTDDTASYLDEYEKNFSLKDKVKITIVTLPENAGGAGGFSAGMRKGYEFGADFVWIFDDDGYPQPTALEKLLVGYDHAVEGLGPDVPYVCSMVKFIDGSISETNNPIPTWDWGRLQAMGYDNLVMVTQCSFVSVLIPRWVMELLACHIRNTSSGSMTPNIRCESPSMSRRRSASMSVVLHGYGR